MKESTKKLHMLAGLFVVLMVCTAGSVSGQIKTNDLYVENQPLSQYKESIMVPLSNVLKKLEQTNHITFLYQPGLIEGKKVSKTVLTAMGLANKIGKLMAQNGLTYEKQAEGIYVIKRLARFHEAERPAAASQVNGTVTDGSTGKTLPGVNIRVKGTTTGTSTDAQGQYELTVESLQDTLVFSFVGYKTRQEPINERTEINIALQPQAISGEEMVVVGYGTQKKKDVTGSISQISTENLNEQPVTSPGKLLQGRVPGLNVKVGSGRPGTSGSFNIRGNTTITGSGSPLILIDGIPGDINDVSPNNIKEVTILKDAAASAIYGSRAAYGVVQITTKDGKAGENRITYSNNFSWKTFETSTDFITSGWRYLQVANEGYQRTLGRSLMGYSDEDLDELYKRRNDKTENPDRPWVVVKPDANGNDVYKYYGNFNWFDFFNNKWRPKQTHNLTFSGGNKEIIYYLSGSLSHEKGIFHIDPDYYNRKNFRSKIDYKMFPWLTISNNTKFFDSKYTYYSTAEGGGFPSGETKVSQYYNFFPSMVPKNPDGTYVYLKDNGNYPLGYGFHAGLMDENIGGNEKKKDLRTTFEAKITLSKNFELRGNYTYRFIENESYFRKVPLTYSLTPGETEPMPVSGYSNWNENKLTQVYGETNHQIVNMYGNYEKSFGSHNLKIMGGFSQHLSKHHAVTGEGYQMLGRTKDDFNLSTGRNELRGGQTVWALRSYFYRLNYNYNEKYYLQIAGRYDGTSRFPNGDRFGNFPTYAVGWKVNKENFFNPLNNIFGLFKVRFSYGNLGNQVVDPYIYIPGLPLYNMSYLGPAHEQLRAVSSPDPISSSLTWEKITTKNLGLNIGILNNKLTLELDGYIRDTKGMLTKGKTLPAVYGAKEPDENAADLRTKGYEVGIKWEDVINIAGSKLSYHLGAHLSDYVGHITKFDNPDKIISDYYKGQKLGDIWGFVYDGFFKTQQEADNYNVDQSELQNRRIAAAKPEDRKLRPGIIKIRDLDGNGKIDYGGSTVNDPGDRKIIGNTQPRWKYGFQLGGSYKGFSLNAIFQGVGHQDYYPSSGSPYYENMLFWSVYARPYASYIPKNFKKKIWSPNNTNAYFPIYYGYEAQNGDLSKPNNMYLQNLAYLKLRNITVGYGLPKTLVNKLRLSEVRLYISAHNLFTWAPGLDTKYQDPDEVSVRSSGRGYPMGKSYSFGVSISF